jgi:hypothetical protein
LVIVLLELALDVVGVVESCFAVWGAVGWVSDLMNAVAEEVVGAGHCFG